MSQLMRGDTQRLRRPPADPNVALEQAFGSHMSYGPRPGDPATHVEVRNNRGPNAAYWRERASASSEALQAERDAVAHNRAAKAAGVGEAADVGGVAGTAGSEGVMSVAARASVAPQSETWVEAQQRRVGGIFYDLANMDRLDDAPDQSFMGKLRYIATRDDRTPTSIGVGLLFLLVVGTFVVLFISAMSREGSDAPLIGGNGGSGGNGGPMVPAGWNEPIPVSAVSAARASGNGGANF